MTRSMIVRRADGEPANKTRRSGYVRQADIDLHGSFAAALAALNARAASNVVALRRKAKGPA